MKEKYGVPRVRVMLVREAPGASRERPVVETGADVARIVREVFAGLPHEVMVVLHLDSRNRVVSLAHVSEGTVSATLVHPREVFRSAILANASGVILAHNHPSGDPTPSDDDMRTWTRVREAGVLIGIPVLDSVVVGDTDWRSCAAI